MNDPQLLAMLANKYTLAKIENIQTLISALKTTVVP